MFLINSSHKFFAFIQIWAELGVKKKKDKNVGSYFLQEKIEGKYILLVKRLIRIISRDG